MIDLPEFLILAAAVFAVVYIGTHFRRRKKNGRF